MIGYIIAASVVFVVLVAAFATYLFTFYSPHKHQNDIHNVLVGEQYDSKRDEMIGLIDSFVPIPYERVQAKSFDGLKLVGQYYHVKDGAPLAICFHGYRGTPVRDYCGGAQLLLKQQHNVLVVNQRAHGESGGHTITFGAKESKDCLSWIDYALERFGKDVKIVLYGISMGASTVLLSLQYPLPPNVVGVLADCPYDTPKSIITKVCRDMKIPPALAYPFIWLGAVLFGHFNPSRHSAIKAVKNATVPVLIIHGEDDRLVPCEMSAKICAANPEHIRRETFPNAAHGISYLTDYARYQKIATEFLHEVLD